jgi:hypothetical protein
MSLSAFYQRYYSVKELDLLHAEVDDKEVDDKDELEAISASTPAERTRPRS